MLNSAVKRCVSRYCAHGRFEVVESVFGHKEDMREKEETAHARGYGSFGLPVSDDRRISTAFS